LFELAMFVRVCLYIFDQEDEYGIETLSHSLCINQIYLSSLWTSM